MSLKAFLDSIEESSQSAFSNLDKVTKDEVLATFDAYKKQVLDKTGIVKDSDLVGSAGKKSLSGDVDVAIELKDGKTIEDLSVALKQLGVEHKIRKGFEHIYTKYPVYDESGKTEKFVEVDLMVGKKDWLKFSHYAPFEGESKYSGTHRAILLAAIMRNAREMAGSPSAAWAVDTAKGLFKKVRNNIETSAGKQKEVILAKHFVTSNPQRVVDLLNRATKGDWTVADLNQPFEKLWAKTKNVFPKEVLDKIRAYVETGIANVKKEQPVMELLNRMKKELVEQRSKKSEKDVEIYNLIKSNFVDFNPKDGERGDLRLAVGDSEATKMMLKTFLASQKVKARIEIISAADFSNGAKSRKFETFKISGNDFTVYVVDNLKMGRKTTGVTLTPAKLGLGGMTLSSEQLYSHVLSKVRAATLDETIKKYLKSLMDSVNNIQERMTIKKILQTAIFNVPKKKQTETLEVDSGDKKSIFNDFGEILSAFFVSKMANKDIEFPSKQNESLIDFYVGGESFSAKHGKEGATPSISGLVNNEKIGEIISSPAEQDFVNLLNIVVEENTVLGILILCKKYDKEAWSAFTSIVPKINYTRGAKDRVPYIRDQINLALDNLESQGQKKLNIALDQYIDVVGHKPKSSYRGGENVNKYGYLTYPLAARLVATLNSKTSLMESFKSIVNKLYLKQIHIFSQDKETSIKFEVKQFSTATPKFDLGHMSANEPTGSKICFKIT